MTPVLRCVAACLGALALLYVLAPNPAAAQKMTFEDQSSGGNLVGSEWIQATGTITPETAAELEARLVKRGRREGSREVLSVQFHSKGGDLAGALRLGEVLRRYNLGSSVGIGDKPDQGTTGRATRPGECAGACAIAVMGGVSRHVGRASKLGLHGIFGILRDRAARPVRGLEVSAERLVAGMLSAYATRMGVDPKVIALALELQPKQTRYLTEAEAKELRLEWSPNALEPWGLQTRGDGLVAFSRSRDQSVTVTMFCRGADPTPRLLFQPHGWTMADYAPLIGDVEGVVAFGAELPKSALILQDVQGRPGLEYVLSGLDVATLVVKKTPYVGAEVASAIRNLFDVSLPRENAEAAFRVALKNCI